MKKKDVIEFFDRFASGWDADMVRDDRKIACILDAAGVSAGKTVLDVACGTGVLFGDYLARGAAHVTAVDISPQMARIASQKANATGICVVCGDVEELVFDRAFDCIVVYNAFPHFEEPKRLIGRLTSLLVPGGRLCVAHGMSLEALHRHHERARHVSRRMLTACEMAAMMEPQLAVETAISDDEKYIVVGRRRA